MTIMSINGGFGHPATGIPIPGFVGSYAWRVRPSQGTKTVLGGLLVTDVPANKPPHASASERCP
ncbi:MAG: hypothetical protein H0V92_09475 [Pseudonocardiales bacterium]|nr:hypothetical protein [Pseudonocardiales bacterium]